MERVTRRVLQQKVDYINRITEFREAYEMDYYNAGNNPNAYALVQRTSYSSGIHRVSSGYRMTAREFFFYLNGFIDALERR